MEFDNPHTTDEFSDQLLNDIKGFDNNRVFTVLHQQVNLYKMADRTGRTLLHYASLFGNDGVVRQLIEMGANINAQDRDGKTPLMLTLRKSQIDTVKVLLEANADILKFDSDGHSSLELVVSDPTAEWSIVEMFLEKVSANCRVSGKRLKSEKLNAGGQNVNWRTAVALSKANCFLQHVMRWNRPHIMQNLLVAGCCVDAYNPENQETALHVAVRESNIINVLMLLNHGANVNARNKDGQTPFMLLRLVDDDNDKKIRILRVLLSLKDTDLYQSDNFGETGLSVIFKHGTILTVQISLNYFISLSQKDSCGDTPLHYLVLNKDADAIDMVEEMEFDANIRNESGYTPLHIASLAGNPMAVRFLLRNGADVNAKDPTGYTSLFLSLAMAKHRRRYLELNKRCIQLLLANGADIECSECKPKTALHMIPLFCINRFGKLIIMHLALREALGTPITGIILKKIKSNDNFKRHLNLYRRTLKQMQMFTVYGSVTLFKLLTENEQKIVRYLCNPNIVKRLVRLSNKCISLNYCFRYLSNRIGNALRQAQLRQRSACIIARLTKLDYNSHRIFLDRIVEYLDDVDLFDLVKDV